MKYQSYRASRSNKNIAIKFRLKASIWQPACSKRSAEEPGIHRTNALSKSWTFVLMGACH